MVRPDGVLHCTVLCCTALYCVLYLTVYSTWRRMIPFFCGTASTVTVSSSRPGPGLPRLPDISPASAALFVFRRRQLSGQPVPVTTMIINRLYKENAFVLGEGKELGGRFRVIQNDCLIKTISTTILWKQVVKY